MNDDIYILTRAHFSGDHCDIFGVFTSLSLAEKAQKELLNKLPENDDNLLIDITKVSTSNFNKILEIKSCNH